ncbi:MAG TPA: hypothetical protein VMB72_11615, partial [Acidimicrobiales bacterium]|nr:hypothetical protein [Acidimicrobiales bacterium]
MAVRRFPHFASKTGPSTSGGDEHLRLLSKVLAASGVGTLLIGAALLGTAVAGTVTTTPGISLTLTVPASTGATCNDANKASPSCSNLKAGDVITLAGTGFSPGATASIVECNDDPSQPNVVFLGQYIPVSCSALALTSIPATGKTKGDLTGTKTLLTGTVGPPVTGTPSCITDRGGSSTTTTSIPGCTTSGSGATDAASYPCPPTSAQQLAGDTCVLSIGDTAGDVALGTILFQGETVGGSTTTSGATTSSTASTTSTTAATTTTTVAPTTTTTVAPTTTTTVAPTTTTTVSPTTTTTVSPTTTTTVSPT